MKIDEIEKLRLQLMQRIDTDDLLEVKKIERYCALLRLDAECDAAIKEEHLVVVTENGAQRFIKTHPAVGEKTKINAQLIAIEKTFNFIDDATGVEPSSAEPVEGTGGFTKDDLI